MIVVIKLVTRVIVVIVVVVTPLVVVHIGTSLGDEKIFNNGKLRNIVIENTQSTRE